MSFINRLSGIMPGQGTPTQNDALFLKQTFVLSGNSAQMNFLTGGLATGLFSPTISKGKIRVKAAAPSTSGANPALTSVDFILDDGTNFVHVGRIVSNVLTIQPVAGSTAAPTYVDRVIEFETDINATRLGIQSTVAGTNPIVLMDVELSGTL